MKNDNKEDWEEERKRGYRDEIKSSKGGGREN